MGGDERDIDKTGSVGITEYPFSKNRHIDATAVNLSSPLFFKKCQPYFHFVKECMCIKSQNGFSNIA